MEAFTIVNATDLAATNFACYFDSSMNPVMMAFAYNASMKTLIISGNNGKAIRFSYMREIHYGNSLK